MEKILRELLAEVRALRREKAYAIGQRPISEAQEGEAEMGVVGERGPEVRAKGEDFDYGQEFFWMSKIEDSQQQEDLLRRFLAVAQNIKCVSIDCAFHKGQFGCALKGAYLKRGKCICFLPREEWLKINGKMGGL